LIVVDTSVAVKWVVAEPGHHDALALFDLTQPRIAPDLVLPEFAYVLRKKVIRGEITSGQMRAAIASIPSAFAQFVPSADLVADAMTFAEKLDHSPYDCFFLACAVGRGVLVSADLVFLRKCEQFGLGANVFVLGANVKELEAKLAQRAASDLPAPGA
jgi:predicted nucleic acid-binding protein